MAFFGSVKIRTKSSSCKGDNVVMIGSLPISSGIRPYLTRSCCSTTDKLVSSTTEKCAPKPIELCLSVPPMILSNPSNAPPQINRIFVVSILTVSPIGFFRLPVTGTSDTVPSMIFSNACCTPSPDTSRVIETFSPFRLILSISSM